MEEIKNEQLEQVNGGGICEGTVRLAGGIIGAGVGGYISGGFGAAAGFAFGQQGGVWLGDMICSR
ncbi:hypothetical protein [Shewanella xiamenensis]|uniref:hypothetical protein n=1 Tax=Shewanella xiamenensis TaxID=332186 RepID=UPI00155941D0|nr:hypothetical protein [Shewanella xiamenensis]